MDSSDKPSTWQHYRAGIIGTSVSVTVSSVVMVALTAHFWHHFRVLMFPSAICTVHDSIYITQYRCHCGSRCHSLYPCLTVNVYLDSKHMPKEDAEWPIPLYIDDKQYISVGFTEEGHLEECAMKKCSPDTTYNRDSVESFRKHFVVNGSNRTCFYDQSNVTKGAFFNRNIHWSLLFHVVFWPCMVMVASLGYWGYIIYNKRRRMIKYELATTEKEPCILEKY